LLHHFHFYHQLGWRLNFSQCEKQTFHVVVHAISLFLRVTVCPSFAQAVPVILYVLDLINFNIFSVHVSQFKCWNISPSIYISFCSHTFIFLSF
jgi:hypothetical protein